MLGTKSVDPISGAFREMDHLHGNRTVLFHKSLHYDAQRVKGTAQQLVGFRCPGRLRVPYMSAEDSSGAPGLS